MTHELPPNTHNPGVHIGDMDVEGEYLKYIESLNLLTPTVNGAIRQLTRWGLNETVWDRWTQRGAEEDTYHEGRALVAIARGDMRPLGELYDQIRRMAKATVDEEDLRQAKATKNKYDPHGERTGYFF